jgi:hypothetical protein
LYRGQEKFLCSDNKEFPQTNSWIGGKAGQDRKHFTRHNPIWFLKYPFHCSVYRSQCESMDFVTPIAELDSRTELNTTQIMGSLINKIVQKLDGLAISYQQEWNPASVIILLGKA